MKELMMKMLLLNNMNYMSNRTSELIVFEPFIDPLGVKTF